MDLLFISAHWHSLAKLRIHTDTMLDILDKTTTVFGQTLRSFLQSTGQQFNTQELPRETAARECRNAKSKSKAKPKDPPGTLAPPTSKSSLSQINGQSLKL